MLSVVMASVAMLLVVAPSTNAFVDVTATKNFSQQDKTGAARVTLGRDVL
jgi:hypothetical protein